MQPRRSRRVRCNARLCVGTVNTITLQSHRVVGLLQPASQFVIKIMFGPYVHKVPSPPGSVIGSLDDSRTIQPASQSEAGQEPGLARMQAGEPDSRDADQARLLRDDLHVAQGLEQANVPAGKCKCARPSACEERLQCESPTRVPQVAADQSRSAFRADPERGFLPLGRLQFHHRLRGSVVGSVCPAYA